LSGWIKFPRDFDKNMLLGSVAVIQTVMRSPVRSGFKVRPEQNRITPSERTSDPRDRAVGIAREHVDLSSPPRNKSGRILHEALPAAMVAKGKVHRPQSRRHIARLHRLHGQKSQQL